MKLNLGCGDKIMPGWTNVDLKKGDVCHDLADFPWPFESESATEILASHVLEHFDQYTGKRFLLECHRLMVLGGTLHLAVPDLDIFVDCINRGDWSAVNGYKWRDLNHFMGGNDGETNLAQRHRYMYSTGSLSFALWQVGFRASLRTGPRDFDSGEYAAISLYLDAVK